MVSKLQNLKKYWYQTMKNLTEGSIFKVLTRLALPIMASSFLGTAYSITDMAWIGKLGSSAVAGIGVGGMYVWLSNGLCNLARMGGQVPMAQELGKGNLSEARKYAVGALWMTLFFGVSFGAISLLFTDTMVSFFNLESPETITYAKEYLQISCGLILFSYIGTVLTGLYTAQGDSKTPLAANFIGLPVTSLTDNAAPPRVSPSSFVNITPSIPMFSLNDVATFTAS